MYQSAQLKNKSLNPYLVKEVMDSSPEQLLIKIYDFAIVQSERQNVIKTNNAIQELIKTLRFDNELTNETSTGLFRLYQYCQDQVRKGNFEIVTNVLIELRDSWVEILEGRR